MQLICAFCYHCDIHYHPENAIKSIVVDRHRKYALLREWRNGTLKAQNIKFSCNKSFGRTALALLTYVQRVLARTAWGVEVVRPEGAWTYVQRTFEPCRTELNESFNEKLRNHAVLCSIWALFFFQNVWNGRHFSDIKMSFCLRVRVTSPFDLMVVDIASEWLANKNEW